MRKNWLIALVGAALLAIVPATALAQGHHARHHAKRHHRVRTHLRHITAATSGTAASTDQHRHHRDRNRLVRQRRHGDLVRQHHGQARDHPD